MTLLIILIVLSYTMPIILGLIYGIRILKVELEENRHHNYTTRNTITHFIVTILLLFIPMYNIFVMLDIYRIYKDL